MNVRRSKTAEEIMGELRADPKFRIDEAERERRRALRRERLDRIEQPVLEDLNSAGFAVESIDDLQRRYVPLPPQAVEVLLSWLPRIQEDRVKESVIRSLGTAREPFDGRPLRDCFVHDQSETLRFPIANTISLTRPFGLDDWLVEAVKNRVFGDARGMLAIAIARLLPTERSLPVLLSVIDEIPGYVAMALGSIGGQTELDALQSRIDGAKRWHKKELLKAIRKIERRLRKAN